MGRKCFLCQNTRYRSKHCRLFRFPSRGTAMWNRWLTAMALSEEDIRPNEHPRVCQRHFDPKHFLTRQLSGMAVPMWHLKRIKNKQLCTVEEYSSSDGRVFDRATKTSGDCTTEYSEILDEKNTNYEEAENVLSEEEELLQDLCSTLLTNATGKEQSNETETVSTLSAFSCTIPQHAVFDELLSLERNRVERLLKMNAQQKQIIEEQRNLLWELGVECVPDKLADDSD
uniref:THAP-type domain-containing protein n=1 Tax=Anopheles funestus TaxID=62324 RepID=A0A182RZR3_ANOFN